MALITEFELGQLYAAVRALQAKHNHNLDKSAATSHISGIDVRSFASELLWYAERFYESRAASKE